MEELLPFTCREYVYQETSMSRDLLDQLSSYRYDGLYTDLEIVAGGQSFKCHRVIIAAASPYFSAMFQHDENAKQKGVLELPKVNPNVFDEMLDFMYTSKLTITSENVIDLLELADFLQFRDLVLCCANILLQHITKANVITILQLADSHLCQPLASAAREFIKEYFEEILKLPDFNNLSLDVLIEFLEDPSTDIQSDEQLMKALCEWIQSEKEERVGYIDELMKFVTLEALSPKFVQLLKENYDFINDSLNNEVLQQQNKHIDNHEKPQVINVDTKIQTNHPIRVVALISNSMNKYEESERNILYCNPTSGKWDKMTKVPFKETVELQRVIVLNNDIYLTGGQIYNVPINRVYKYDVIEDQWSEVTSMNHARCNHGATSALGFLFVFGGKIDQDNLTNTFEQYNPCTDQWTLLEPMHSCFPDVYDSFASWYNVANCDLVHLGDYLYVIGGTQACPARRRGTGEQSYSKHEDIERFNLQTRTWSHCHELKRALAMAGMTLGHGTSFAYNGLLLLIDEDIRGKKAKLYNPVTNQIWDFISTHGQHRFGGYAIQKNTLYAFGGLAGFDDGLSTHDLVHSTELCLGTNWKMLDPLPKALAHYTAVIVSKNLD